MFQPLPSGGDTLSSDLVLGLSGADWSAIAAASQALAAVGAVALLVVTLLSQRDARSAMENARRLALHTQALVDATKAQAELGVRPVIEVTQELRNRRFRLSNRGNGPLLGPRAQLNGSALTIVHEDVETSAFIRSAAIASGEHAFALLDSSAPVEGALTVMGFTMSGNQFSSTVSVSGSDGRSAELARPRGDDQP